MGPEKGRGLKQALLTRNKSSWHSFDEIEGIADNWDEDTVTSHERTKQHSLERNNSFFPWSTPKPMSDLAGKNARGTINRRRRMSQRHSSASPASMELALRQLQDCLQDERSDFESTSSIV